MKAAGLLLLGVVVMMGYWVSQAQALPQFKKAFQEKYVDNSTDANFKAEFKQASCNVCHVKGKEKSVRNDYGKALAKFTGGTVHKDMAAATSDDDKKAILDKAIKAINEAFDKVADEKSSSGDTYGDLIKAGKLPNSK